jgi:hypothetical protein
MNKRNVTKRTPEEINNLITEWEQSKICKKKFCDSKGINYQTFFGWFVQRRERINPQMKKFIPVQIEQSGAMFAEIQLNKAKKIILYRPVSVEFFRAILKC